MSEETKTQGIKTETTTKDIPNTTKTTSKTELLDLRAGIPRQKSQFSTQTTYFHDKQPISNPKILNVLVQFETEGKSDYTIRNIDKFLERINRKGRTRQLSNESQYRCCLTRTCIFSLFQLLPCKSTLLSSCRRGISGRLPVLCKRSRRVGNPSPSWCRIFCTLQLS